uniref:NADH-ubiquinone oxidoreductase chain 2 n=1 Tax=Perochirus ateles TaxID=1127070 RepID=G9HTR0_9SAUR|nr:NADH dehydrogenase subunit 2 [Perochirus ateles]
MNPMFWMLLLTSITSSTIITMSSHNWVLAWIGLEMNTLSILPIIMKPHHPRATEATTKYFLVQTTSASLILFAAAASTWQTGHWAITQCTPNMTMIITLAIMLKLGLAPMHAWYPDIIQGSTLNTAMIISTWQKLAPLALLYMMINQIPTQILLLTGLLSALIGGWTGLNQTQTRKIMAFSSIAHMGWLITAMAINPSLTTLTMLMYMVMTTTTFTALNSNMTKTLQNMSTSWSSTPLMLIMLSTTLMSLGGLPPLTGFTPKWLILKEMTSTGLTSMATLLALASLPSLFFYIRMMYITTMTTPPNTTSTEHKWRFKPNTPHLLAPMMILSTLLLPMTAALYNTL